MKNVRFQSALLSAIVVLLVIGCEPATSDEDSGYPKGGAINPCLVVEPGNATYVSFSEYLANTSLYKTKVADRMTREFRATSLSSGAPKLGSQHITFSVAALKSFIKDIEDQLGADPSINPEDLAITWSYGVYSDRYFPIERGNDYKQLQTLYGVPSVRVKEGYKMLMLQDTSWTYLHEYLENVLPTISMSTIKDLPDDVKIFGLGGEGENGVDADANQGDPEVMNRGALCPPGCDPDQVALNDLIAGIQ